jgi:hypothetical protein
MGDAYTGTERRKDRLAAKGIENSGVDPAELG